LLTLGNCGWTSYSINDGRAFGNASRNRVGGLSAPRASLGLVIPRTRTASVTPATPHSANLRLRRLRLGLMRVTVVREDAQAWETRARNSHWIAHAFVDENVISPPTVAATCPGAWDPNGPQPSPRVMRSAHLSATFRRVHRFAVSRVQRWDLTPLGAVDHSSAPAAGPRFL
jgi:hypothetical protein